MIDRLASPISHGFGKIRSRVCSQADFGHETGHFINDQASCFADGEVVAFALNTVEGGNDPLLAQMEGLDTGSDHAVFFKCCNATR